MRKGLIMVLCWMAVTVTSSATVSTLDSLLNVLEKEVAQSSVYIERHQDFINALRASKPMTPELQLRIAKEYQHFQSDSSLVWYLKLRNADEPIRSQAFMGIVSLLASIGRYGSAITLLQDEQAPSIKHAEGYKMAWLLYNDVVANTPLPFMKERMQVQADAYYDALMAALEQSADTNKENELWLLQYRATEKGDWEEALRCNLQLIKQYNEADHMFAILAYGHAMLYEQAGDSIRRSEWLVRSAITDVRCGITDNGSSWVVAQDCFDAGDVKRAYLFSDYSLTNASFFNAPTRYIQNFTQGHLIGSQHEYELNRFSLLMTILLVLLAIALIAMVITVIYSVHQNKRLHALNSQLFSVNSQLSAMNRQLKEADKVKEQYICRYLEVYSDYIRRLTSMARKAGEKDSAAFMDREMDNFYRSFDDTFLSLYGTFVQDFNALLKPEMRLTPKPGERMTVEMRIFALILLGITSSAKIAELLCYSPNTISNYRVKMKNGAIGDRDSFELQVQQIGK
ncbi:MAG: hypothetical protein IKT19_00530 [Paludibacteraceae bacterium]|nr:hypothetical protein [Paludibacteraceae bacterium]